MNYFYQPEIIDGNLTLEGEEFNHCIKVLRNKPGNNIGILDGIGGFYMVKLTSVQGKTCAFEVLTKEQKTAKSFHHHIALAPTKNIDRTEWFVEKACEFGVDEITFIETNNSERTKLRLDRLEKKVISALKQSKSGFITRINELTPFKNCISKLPSDTKKFIAYVDSDLPYYSQVLAPGTAVMTLIGPEGDFSEAEVVSAKTAGFTPISLGGNVLRTETAGIAACLFINQANGY